jgi:hypothetical protein
MSKTLLLCSLILTAVLATCHASAGTYQEAGGIVVIEAEHFDSRAAATDDDHHFAIVPDELSAADLVSPDGQYLHARGGKYMVSLPDMPGGGQNRNTEDLRAPGPHLDYKVQINTTGEYQLYVRALGYDGSSDSGYAHIVELTAANGGPGPDWYRFSMNPDTGDFNTLYLIPWDPSSTAGWIGFGSPQQNNGGDNGNDIPVVWNITKPGLYTIEWQQREDGNGFDALVFQRSNLPIPAPDVPESPLVGATAQALSVVAAAPGASNKVAQFQSPNILIAFADGSTKLDTNSVTLQIDGGAAVKPSIERNGTSTFAKFQPSPIFAPNSTHSIVASYKDTTGASFTKTWTATLPNYSLIPSTWTATPDKSQPGFIWNMSQVDNIGSFAQNSIARAEAQLAGTLGSNIADSSVTGVSSGPGTKGGPNDPIQFQIPTVINLVKDTTTGPFGNFQPDDQMPGSPGTGGGTDNQAAETLAYLDLPAGVIVMGVNSDDGFKLTSGPNVKDVLGALLGQFDGGRGAADTVFSFVVEKAGVYPFRMVWENGGGDANVEWFSVASAAAFLGNSGGNTEYGYNSDILINDNTNSLAIKSSRVATGGQPYVKTFSPDFFGFTFALADTSSSIVDSNSVAVTLDGNALGSAAAITKSNDLSAVTYKPSTPWVSGSSHTLGFTFKDTTGASYARVATFTAPTGYVPSSYAWGAADKTKPGFLVRTWQSGTQPNDIEWTEDQLAGLHGTNQVAHPEVFTDSQFGNKYFDESGTINYWWQGVEGDFPNNGTQNVPGLPNGEGAPEQDNYSLEIITFLDLPAGPLQMGVNSDDGFRVYAWPSGKPVDKGIAMGEFNGGRGAADTIFNLTLQSAGIYPFRMVYEQGGGDSEVEWFTVTADGTQHLINDSTDTASIKAYRSAQAPTNQPPSNAHFTSFSLSGGTLTLSWTGGSLDSADGVTGPWTAMPNATSPAAIPVTGTRKFFRVR